MGEGLLAMSLQGLTTILPPPRRHDAAGFAGNTQEIYDRRAAFRRVSDAFHQSALRRGEDRAPQYARDEADRRTPVGDNGEIRRTGRRAGDRATAAGLHLKLPTTPEFVRHSTPFVAQAIGQDRGAIDQRSGGLSRVAAAYEAGVARVDSFFSVIEPIEVYA